MKKIKLAIILLATCIVSAFTVCPEPTTTATAGDQISVTTIERHNGRLALWGMLGSRYDNVKLQETVTPTFQNGVRTDIVSKSLSCSNHGYEKCRVETHGEPVEIYLNDSTAIPSKTITDAENALIRKIERKMIVGKQKSGTISKTVAVKTDGETAYLQFSATWEGAPNGDGTITILGRDITDTIKK